MFTLMVSFDAGISYQSFLKSESLDEILKRTEKRDDFLDDISWTRWYIEEDGKSMDEIVCPIHKNIFETLEKLNRRE